MQPDQRIARELDEPSEGSPARESSARQRRRLERLAWLLDESIPLPGGFRIGFDSVIGLIPGIGDGVGLATSTYILTEAWRAGAGKLLLLRMMVNIVIEAIVGAVPIVGDLFDMAWKSNSRNVALMRQHMGDSEQARKRSLTFLIVLLLIVCGLFVAVIALAVVVISALVSMVAGMVS